MGTLEQCQGTTELYKKSADYADLSVYQKAIYDDFMMENRIDNCFGKKPEFRLAGLKTHSKTILKVNGDGSRTNVSFLGNGNYLYEVFSYKNEAVRFKGKDLDKLQSKYDHWYNTPTKSYKEYIAPDGTIGRYSFFLKEAKAGRLHGCIIKKVVL